MKKSAFTLTELLIVLVIVAILVSLGVPTFRRAQERGADREAQTNLKLLQSAHKARVLSEGAGTECGDNQECSNRLGLDLAPDPSQGGNWLYRVVVSGAANYAFEAMGDSGTPDTGWRLGEDDHEATPVN